MSFHKYIIGSFVVFILFMGYLSVRSFQTDVNLVSPNYYEKELVYEEHMAALSATKKLQPQPLLSLDEVKKQLTFQMPQEHNNSVFDVLLFRPSDSHQDKNFTYDGNLFQLDYAALTPGMWQVQVQWEHRGQRFYYEEDVRL